MSPWKLLRSIKRITKYAEKKRGAFAHNPISKPLLEILTLPQIDIPPEYPKLSIVCVQTTTVPPYQPTKPRLSVVHVERTTLLPQSHVKPKLSISHVQTTTVPPQQKARPRLSIAHVQTTTVPPDLFKQFASRHLKIRPN